MEHFESLYPANTRENEIEKILSFIKEGSSCQAIGLPGGGRSNLLGLLSYNRNVRLKHLGENQKWFHFVLCNFAEVRKRSLFDTTKFLFLNLVDSLRSRYENVIPSSALQNEESLSTQTLLNKIPPLAPLSGDLVGMTGEKEIKKLIEIFRESIVGDDELVLFHGLKRAIDFLAIEKELTIVFLFDRFEDYVSTASPEFFTNLRVLRDRAKYRFSVVFSLHKPLEDLIGEDILLDFYQFVAGHTVYLSLFDKPGLNFRISYIEKASGKTLEKEIIDIILDQTSGHANLTRLCIETALETSLKNVILGSPAQRDDSRIPIVQRDSGQARMTSFLLEQKPIRAALFDIWKSLSPSEQNLLSHRHSGKPVSRRAHPESPMAIRDAGQASMTTDENYVHLYNVGLIKNGKITIPLFAQFLKQFDRQSSHIAFDLNTLSDALTSYEFKLLTFLSQNSNRVIEREEVINAVWKDNKSSAGVTDQALDQLIFRLRKKIEGDPNRPKHLQTMKGRGVRFSP